MSAYVITAVLAAGLPAAVQAQGTPQPPAAVPAVSPSEAYGAIQSHWIVSGFVGSNWGGAATNASVNFGGQLAYLWKGVLGAEGIADFAPSFKLDNPALNQNPHANGYMGNVIAALPLGNEGQFQPYVSGGVGIIQMKADVLNLFLPHPSGTLPTGFSSADESAFGSNIGGGLMGFVGLLGFRADVRYYKANTTSTTNTASPEGQFTEGLLSGLNYWRANIGVALRW